MGQNVKIEVKIIYMDFHAVKLLYFQKNDGFQADQVAISRGTHIRGGGTYEK